MVLPWLIFSASSFSAQDFQIQRSRWWLDSTYYANIQDCASHSFSRKISHGQILVSSFMSSARLNSMTVVNSLRWGWVASNWAYYPGFYYQGRRRNAYWKIISMKRKFLKYSHSMKIERCLLQYNFIWLTEAFLC